tara:strand:+ start:3859 stop:4068 length:210 start_codon:yes stop_codon:yes gene_type:complete
MSDYGRMTRLACFVASQYVGEYDRDTVEMMVESVGWEAADDFYELYEKVFGADVDEIRGWIDEMAQEDE